MSFPLTIGMAIVCLKNSADNPLSKTELAINYPSPAGFADGLRGGDRDYGMIRDRSAVLGPNAVMVLVAAVYPDRQLRRGAVEVGLPERRADDELRGRNGSGWIVPW